MRGAPELPAIPADVAVAFASFEFSLLWFGREIGVHGVVAKCDGVYFRCAMAGGHEDRWLEVPAWMFEQASCSGGLQRAAPSIKTAAAQP